MKKPLSLYVHIPFCYTKCLYCDFLSGPSTPLEREEYVRLLCQEIGFWGRQIGEQYRLDTIFLGGGTPSCLSPGQLDRLGNAIQEAFDWSEQGEYTTEANPGTVTAEHTEVWKRMGVNRVSLGLQSTQDAELKRLGRIHTYREFLETYALLRKNGFGNINVDLMADIPGQTVASYRDTLRKVASLAPEHISAYSLIVEEGTPFYEMEQRGLLEREDEEADREMYELTAQYLGQQGYRRYEISNYALSGYPCRHNCACWQCREYLGTGLGASSYLQGYRFRNQTEREAYGDYVGEIMSQGREADWRTFRFCEMNKTDRKMQMEEFCFLGLRMSQGISRAEFGERFGTSFDRVYGTVATRLIEKKLLAEDCFHDRLYLTDRGIDVSNRVLSEFLLEADFF